MANNNKNYLFLLFLAVFLVLSYLLIKPFLSALVGAAILTYVLYPLYGWFNKKTKNSTLSAAVMIIIILIVITIPFVLISNLVIKESTNVYNLIDEGKFIDQFRTNSTCTDGFVCESAKYLNEKLSNPIIRENVREIGKNLLSLVLQKGSTFLLSLPEKILFLFILLFTSYYLFKQGPAIMEFITQLIPLDKKHKKKLIFKMTDMIYATVYGAIVIAAIQGTIGGIGYFLFGIKNFGILAILTMLSSLLPFVGTGLVWVPLSLYMAAHGILLGDNTQIFKAMGLFAYGALAIATLDNFLRPKIIGDRAKVNPVIILIGAFGGLRLFGFFGIFVGPVILVILITLLEFYLEARKG